MRLFFPVAISLSTSALAGTSNVKSLSVAGYLGCAVAEDDKGSFLSCFGPYDGPKKLLSYANPSAVRLTETMACISSDVGVVCEHLNTNQTAIVIPKARNPKLLESDSKSEFCAAEKFRVNCWKGLSGSHTTYDIDGDLDEIVVDGKGGPCVRKGTTWKCLNVDLTMNDTTQLARSYGNNTCWLTTGAELKCDYPIPYMENPSRIFRHTEMVFAIDELGIWGVVENNLFNFEY